MALVCQANWAPGNAQTRSHPTPGQALGPAARESEDCSAAIRLQILLRLRWLCSYARTAVSCTAERPASCLMITEAPSS
jgi:hypothetical protein